MSKAQYDFGGYATKNNLKCTDGRVILKDAFKENNGMIVPLVWQHQHNEPSNVLGHALLENREDGVYAYCKFNTSESGKNAKILVEHGDVASLSIFANQLVEKAKNVIHGMIREVSLVMAGANPGAVIDNLAFEHSDGSVVTDDEEAIIYTSTPIEFEQKKEEVKEEKKEIQHADGASAEEDGDETVQDVFNTLTDKQKTAVYAIIDELTNGEEEGSAEQADQTGKNLNDEGDTGIMKSNVFEDNQKNHVVLSHDQFQEIIADAKKSGSLKQAFIAHAGTYGIDNIDYLFPDYKTLTNEPSLVKRDMTWVPVFVNATRHTPFSRIKSVHADITVETARALGYITGGLKKEEVFGLLKRTTAPTTVYKKQKLDRDDVVDITDLDVVAWLKGEMRVMLDEEIARAALVGDGRAVISDDKIDETCIRPIWTDDALYSHKVQLTVDKNLPEEVMDEIVKARVNYKGSGSPWLFTSPSFLTSMLLIKDSTGRRIYNTEQDLAAALRVSRIVEVPLMEGLYRTDTGTDYDLLAIMVNPYDYTIGADKGGAVSMFDDFDIDYNQFKYLIETRCSGALTLPKSALVIERAQA